MFIYLYLYQSIFLQFQTLKGHKMAAIIKSRRIPSSFDLISGVSMYRLSFKILHNSRRIQIVTVKSGVYTLSRNCCYFSTASILHPLFQISRLTNNLKIPENRCDTIQLRYDAKF